VLTLRPQAQRAERDVLRVGRLVADRLGVDVVLVRVDLDVPARRADAGRARRESHVDQVVVRGPELRSRDRGREHAGRAGAVGGRVVEESGDLAAVARATGQAGIDLVHVQHEVVSRGYVDREGIAG